MYVITVFVQITPKNSEALPKSNASNNYCYMLLYAPIRQLLLLELCFVTGECPCETVPQYEE